MKKTTWALYLGFEFGFFMLRKYYFVKIKIIHNTFSIAVSYSH